LATLYLCGINSFWLWPFAQWHFIATWEM